ncbi:tetratricopeptide repeat protein [Marinobacterium lutimaris]|uniref:Tetratricopeptide repeat-containing protein n=1 Tax=Marinobacterium lutimaris TaxID=568106 RepID=A0A1H6DHQ8_9GAMM|nr:tetratricopeptide repeat protein [Marinobacterium lutimaris]SEG84749.1 Tetratricopeptide repeat-containing protein [Marinobacterium lutimaris]
MMIRTSFFAALLILLCLNADAADNWQPLQQQAQAAYQGGDYAKAETLLQRAIARARRADNGAAFEAASLSLLAYVQMAQGQSDSALETQQRALVLNGRARGSDSVAQARLLLNLAGLAESAGQTDKAIDAYRQALAIYRQHPEQMAARLQGALGLSALLQQGQPEAAIEVARSALETSAESDFYNSFQENRRQLSYQLAQLYSARGAASEALAVLEQQRDRESHTLSEEDTRRAETLERMAQLIEEQLPQQDSVALRAEAQQIRERSGELSLAGVINLYVQAQSMLQGGEAKEDEIDKAEQLLQDALARLERLGDTGASETAQSQSARAAILGNLGVVSEIRKQRDEALDYFRQSLALMPGPEQDSKQDAAQASGNADLIQRGNTEGRIGALLYQQKAYSDAEPHFVQSLQLLRRANADTAALETVLNNLITLYDAWGKASEKSRYRKQLRALRDENRAG